ncbi:MAG: response regulator, partial [Planctomycetota bacterium]
MDGKEVLRELRKDLSLRLIPVVVLSTSDHDKDVLESYGLDSNAYIVKPVEVSQFFEVVRIMQEFWVSVVKLPLSDVQPKA